MADILINKIPLPIPRPMMEEVHLGSANPGIDWSGKIPFPEMSDIDLSYPLLGTNWLMYPFHQLNNVATQLKDKTMNLWNEVNIYTSSEKVANLGNEVLAMLLGLGIIFLIGSLIYYTFYGLYLLGKKLIK